MMKRYQRYLKSRNWKLNTVFVCSQNRDICSTFCLKHENTLKCETEEIYFKSSFILEAAEARKTSQPHENHVPVKYFCRISRRVTKISIYSNFLRQQLFKWSSTKYVRLEVQVLFTLEILSFFPCPNEMNFYCIFLQTLAKVMMKDINNLLLCGVQCMTNLDINIYDTLWQRILEHF